MMHFGPDPAFPHVRKDGLAPAFPLSVMGSGEQGEEETPNPPF